MSNTKVEKKTKTDQAEEDKALHSKTDQEGQISPTGRQSENWLEGEDFSGQLAVDVYQTKDEIIIKSTIAGVKPEDIDISINNDMITVRGKREKDHEVVDDNYFYRECYWGGFSRSIILPCEVKTDKISASMKNGVLTVIMQKATKTNKVTVVKVKEE
jgi:HSP20 family protein